MFNQYQKLDEYLCNNDYVASGIAFNGDVEMIFPSLSECPLKVAAALPLPIFEVS